MKTQQKPEFSAIYYDPSQIVWGQGNNVVTPNLLARIKIRDLNKKEEREAKKQYEADKDLYDRVINKNTRFIAGGDKANKDIKCRITFVNYTKQTVSWKQYNINEMKDLDSKIIYKPAAGKVTINGFMQMVKSKQIIIIN